VEGYRPELRHLPASQPANGRAPHAAGRTGP
jgi:hypothetical protein